MNILLKIVLASSIVCAPLAGANELGNPGFEDDSTGSYGNNIPNSPRLNISPWVATNNQNVVKVDGPGGFSYGSSGPESDASGASGDRHYLDMEDSAGNVYQPFTVSEECGSGEVRFGGYFSSRDGSGSSGEAHIEIVQGVGKSGAIVAITPTINPNPGPTKTTPWKLANFTANLTAGQTYSMAIYMDDNLNFDEAYVNFITGSCQDNTDLGETPVCGNGIQESGESCDDGNSNDFDSCDNTCNIVDELPFCGNGIQESGESCDDGNSNDFDSCDNTCNIVDEPPSDENVCLEVEHTLECTDSGWQVTLSHNPISLLQPDSYTVTPITSGVTISGTSPNFILTGAVPGTAVDLVANGMQSGAGSKPGTDLCCEESHIHIDIPQGEVCEPKKPHLYQRKSLLQREDGHHVFRFITTLMTPIESPNVLQITDTLPAGVTLTSVDNSSGGSDWSCPGLPITGPATITCTYVGAMPVTGNVQFDILTEIEASSEPRKNCVDAAVMDNGEIVPHDGVTHNCVDIPEVPDDSSCTPSCGGLVCGSDGCGGSCGACEAGELCTGGLCGPIVVDEEPSSEPDISINKTGPECVAGTATCTYTLTIANNDNVNSYAGPVYLYEGTQPENASIVSVTPSLCAPTPATTPIQCVRNMTFTPGEVKTYTVVIDNTAWADPTPGHPKKNCFVSYILPPNMQITDGFYTSEQLGEALGAGGYEEEDVTMLPAQCVLADGAEEDQDLEPQGMIVMPEVSLELGKSAPKKCKAGGVCDFMITVKNPSKKSMLGSVTITDLPNRGFGRIQSASNGWHCVKAGKGYSCTHPQLSLKPGKEAKFTLALSVPRSLSGKVKNCVEVSKPSDEKAKGLLLQSLLKQAGYDPKGLDGKPGKGTKQAIAKYAKEKGLSIKSDDFVAALKSLQAGHQDVVSNKACTSVFIEKPKLKCGFGKKEARGACVSICTKRGSHWTGKSCLVCKQGTQWNKRKLKCIKKVNKPVRECKKGTVMVKGKCIRKKKPNCPPFITRYEPALGICVPNISIGGGGGTPTPDVAPH